MTIGDLEKPVYAFQEAGRILPPKLVVEVHPHRVEAERFGPLQFPVDGLRVKGVGLPQFELVDGRAGQKLSADQPSRFPMPGVGSLLGPTFTGNARGGARHHNGHCEARPATLDRIRDHVCAPMALGVQGNTAGESPEGSGNTMPADMGRPKFGEPSTRQVKRCMFTCRLQPAPRCLAL